RAGSVRHVRPGRCRSPRRRARPWWPPSGRPGVLAILTRHADVAQLVEHHLAKVRVAGSSPVVRSVEPLVTGSSGSPRLAFAAVRRACRCGGNGRMVLAEGGSAMGAYGRVTFRAMRRSMLLVLAITVVGLAACGGSNSNSGAKLVQRRGTSTSASSSTTTTTTAPSQFKVGDTVQTALGNKE